jgi:hypothetical protein
MITDYIIDNFEILVKLAVGTFCAFLIAIGLIMFIGICYVIIDDWKKRSKKNEKNTDRSSMS